MTLPSRLYQTGRPGLIAALAYARTPFGRPIGRRGYSWSPEFVLQ